MKQNIRKNIHTYVHKYKNSLQIIITYGKKMTVFKLYQPNEHTYGLIYYKPSVWSFRVVFKLFSLILAYCCCLFLLLTFLQLASFLGNYYIIFFLT